MDAEVRDSLAAKRALAFGRPGSPILRDGASAWVALVGSLPRELRCRVGADSAVDGTSAPCCFCRAVTARTAEALPLAQGLPRAGRAGSRPWCRRDFGPASASSRSGQGTCELINQHQGGPFLLRHSADWLMGWLLGHWRWGEEGQNNLRLGWDLAGGALAGKTTPGSTLERSPT